MTFIHLGQDKIRDSFAELIGQICHQFRIDSKFQLFQSENIFDQNALLANDDPRVDFKTERFVGFPDLSLLFTY